MTKQKNRGWVKNVAIIFLTVLLLLTFLSNTIMNRSLPEVAAQYVNSGSVTTRVRGTGTVTANESYEVKLTQSRKIQSVAVRVGDQVSVGDTLIYLTGEVSDELKIAQSELDNLELNYQKALLAASSTDYAKENRDIQLAREALADAELERDSINYSEEAVAAAQETLNAAKAYVTQIKRNKDTAEDSLKVTEVSLDAARTNMNTAKENLDSVENPNNRPAEDTSSRDSAYRDWQTAVTALNAITIQYGNDKKILEKAANTMYEGDKTRSVADYMQYLSNLFSKLDSYKDKNIPEEDIPGTLNPDGELIDGSPDDVSSFSEGQKKKAFNLHVAYEEIKTATDTEREKYYSYKSTSSSSSGSSSGVSVTEYNRLNNAYQAARTAYEQINSQYTQEEIVVKQLERELASAENAQEDAQEAYDKVSSVKQEVADAKAKVRTCQTNLEDLIFALQEQQKADGKVSATNALDLAAQRKAINEKTNEIVELTRNAEGGSVISDVAGTVAAIGVTAGDTAQPDTALITIQVDDRGYSLSFAVTTEQSRKLSVGDTADVTNFYWGGDINATITGIRNDPENPQSSKIVSFAVSGDVEPGTSLTLSVGQKSANYDMIVPNSALRSDNNGDFVLIVIAKSTPLGNRYIAQRADVKILASDDTMTAVSGALTSGDFVITTSTAPIEAGMQVRMAET